MAFTTSQEEILEKIIEAYQNGKRLSDLPEATGTNPYKLYCEVLDEDGESKKAALAAMLPYVEEQCSYGVEKDFAVSSTSCTRVGSTDLHKSLPIQTRMKGCLLDDDGNVVEYLGSKSWTGNTRDGSRGQVMVEIPAHYRKTWWSGTVYHARISELPLPGYTFIPKMYISAYEASLDRTNGKLASVVNDTAQYRGGNNNSSYDGASNTLLGRPVTQQSLTSFRSYARKRKTTTTEWNAYVHEAHLNLFWLYAIEYANFNSQLDYNAALTSEGYRQGGLGAGVTTLDWGKWNSFNGYCPFIPCGYTDELGNGTGIVAYEMPTEYSETTVTVSVPRYRGIENPFGHIWKWTDGIHIEISATEENGGNGLSMVYTCDDPSKFNDSNDTGYRHVGNAARAQGYIQKIIGGEYGEIIPSSIGGGSTTYVGDNFYTSIPSSGTSLRVVLFGGGADHGSCAGLACAASNDVPSSANATFGSRLCFLPVA